MRIGRISKILSPSYSWCQRCNTTWKFVNPRPVSYGEGMGYFALCEDCWDETTLAERLFYYRMSFVIWGGKSPEDIRLIEKAVLESL